MIKVECKEGSGNIMIRGEENTVFNELSQLVKYMVLVHSELSIQAIDDGIKEALEELSHE